MTTTHSYLCAACGDEFVDFDFDQALDEAGATFTPAELVDSRVVCHDCWQMMRERMPDFGARYGEDAPR